MLKEAQHKDFTHSFSISAILCEAFWLKLKKNLQKSFINLWHPVINYRINLDSIYRYAFRLSL